MLLFGLGISGLLIAWLVTGIESLSSQSGITSFILNAIVIVIVLGLVYKLISGGVYYKKNAFFKLIINSLFYIPCILVNIIDIGEFNETPRTYYILLASIIGIYLLYFLIVPKVQNSFTKQGGTLLVNAPVYTDSENIIGSYDELNGTNSDEDNLYDYQYAISCWVFLDAFSPNISSSLDTYTSILNYGGKPNILYNASKNTLMITMNVNDDSTEGNKIVYKMKNVLLQKWNNIIINYSGGTVDIFYNGVLVKSFNKIVSKMSKDTLTIGSKNGVHGGICNVNYFNTAVNASQIYYLYNTVKDKNPPIATSSKQSIIKTISQASTSNYKPPKTTIIPIKIDFTDEPAGLEVSPDQPIKSDPNALPYTDYLSFKWFAVANNDQYNGL